jgi:two-component system, OmpR family, KDP operon response regulator KdpE
MAIKKRVLVVDDESEITRLVSSQLRPAGYDVDIANDGAEAIARFDSHQPDLIILDIMMPVMDGCAVCTHIRKTSRIPIIMLSAKADEQEKVKLLNLGADDYVTKPFGSAELLARVGAALRRADHDSAPLSQQEDMILGDIAISFSQRKVMLRGNVVDLTPTEFSLLQELALNTGKVLTYSHLLQTVWGPEYREERQYLHVFMGRLRTKLERDPEHPEHFKTVPRIGYILNRPSPPS